MDEEQDLLGQDEAKSASPTAREQLTALVQDGRQLVETEIEFLKGRLDYSGQIVRRTGLLGALSLFFIFSAVVALVLGLLLIIASFFGPVIATLSVTFTFALAALYFAAMAKRCAKKLSMPELSEDELNG